MAKAAKAGKKAAAPQAKPAKKAAAKAATTSTKKAAAKPPKKAAKAAAGKGNPAFMAPLTVSPDLQKVVGKDPLPRTEIIKKMWDYIKGHNLQDQSNKRMINADDTLKTVFGGKKQVSMFELAKIVNNHVK